jgi:hypothetical protein
MEFIILTVLSTPMTWLLVTIVVALLHRFQRANHPINDPGRIVRSGPSSPEALSSALMFLSMAYRPNHAFVAKAQIVEREDADDDDQGGPDTARKHLLRQLRRIRRGEKVDRLVLRL